jgi:dienelactone hydrolase
MYIELHEGMYEIRNYEYYRRSEAEGKEHLDQLLSLYSNSEQFDKRKIELRKSILESLGIKQPTKKSALNTIITSKVVMDGYKIENVAFESIPGVFVFGTLYTPTKGKAPFPVILNPHGHFFNAENPSLSADSGRYTSDMQYRCASLAKMGAIVLNYDMYAWGESAIQAGGFPYHETGFSLAMQTWNSIRALDFLLSLKGADKKRVGVTGASGGGTQTFLLAALDDRVTASVPVVMVSSSFYGGCSCESGLPIHEVNNGYKTNNAEIAAMAAPRPQLVISDGADWTKSVPNTDYPYLKKVYGFYGQDAIIESVYLPDDQHDYGFSKRVPMYKFLAKVLDLNLNAVIGKDGNIEESDIKVQTNKEMRVLGKGIKLPSHALKSHNEIIKAFVDFQSN